MHRFAGRLRVLLSRPSLLAAALRVCKSNSQLYSSSLELILSYVIILSAPRLMVGLPNPLCIDHFQAVPDHRIFPVMCAVCSLTFRSAASSKFASVHCHMRKICMVYSPRMGRFLQYLSPARSTAARPQLRVVTCHTLPQCQPMIQQSAPVLHMWTMIRK